MTRKDYVLDERDALRIGMAAASRNIAREMSVNAELIAALKYLVDVCGTADKPLAANHNALNAARAALAKAGA